MLCQLGEVYDAAGRLTEALRAAPGRGARCWQAWSGRTTCRSRTRYNRLGHVLNCADDIEGAIVAHRRALAALDRGRPGRPAPTGAHRPGVHAVGGRAGSEPAGAALRAARAALAAQGRRDGRDWAHATAGLGMVEQDSGRLAAAVEHQRTVIEVFTRVCGADHPDTAQALDKLGYVLRLQGQLAESMASARAGGRGCWSGCWAPTTPGSGWR